MKYINEKLNRMLTIQALEAVIDYASEYGYDDEDFDELSDDSLEISATLTVKTAFNALELRKHIYEGYKMAFRISYPEMEGYETPVILVDGKDVVYEDLYRYDYLSKEYVCDNNIYYTPRYVHCSILIDDYYDFLTVNSKDVAIYEPYIVERTAEVDDDYDLEEASQKFNYDYDNDDLPF